MMRPSSSCRRGAATLLAVAMASGCATSLPVARVEPVTIHARGNYAEIDAFAASVDAALAEIAGRLELSIPARGLDVYLFDSTWEMRSYLREHCPEQSGKAAACFSRPGGFAITVVKSARPGRTDRALRHELTHYLLASHYRELPRWIDEGLAQYFETDLPEVRRKKCEEFAELSVRTTESAVAELLARPPQSRLAREQYLLSWALASFLLEGERLGRGRLKRYLSEVTVEGEPIDRFEAIFGSLKQLRPAWESFLARRHLNTATTSRTPTRCIARASANRQPAT